MLSWLGKRLIARNMRKLREGDPGPTLRLDAKDIRFTFPGDSSWATEIEGKESLEEWLRRFVEVGLQIYPDEVVLKGFPWKQTVCVRGRDHLDAPSGERVYASSRRAPPYDARRDLSAQAWGRGAAGRLRRRGAGAHREG